MTAPAVTAPAWSIGHAVRQTLHFCRSHALVLLAVQAPGVIAQGAAGILFARGEHPLLFGPALAVGLLANALAPAACCRLALNFWSGRSATLSDALAVASRRMLPFLWTNLLIAAGTMLGLLLLIVPGVVFAVRYALGGVVSIAEPPAGRPALRRGRELLSGLEWRAAATVLALVALLLMVVVLVGAAEGAGRAIGTPFLGGGFVVLAVLLGMAIAMLVTPAWMALLAWIYTLRTGIEPRAADREPVHLGLGAASGALVAVVGLLVVEQRALFKALWIPSGAMLPTIAIGDHMFMDATAYDLREPFWGTVLVERAMPRRGDVIVFRSPVDGATDLVKRVVGLPGERIAVRDKQVFVNGARLDEPYVVHSDPVIQQGPRDQMEEVTLDAGDLFMLGDNRDRSYDSRFWGPARRSAVWGRAGRIYWSRDPEGPVRWGRIGQRIE